jgi:cytochrome b561
MNIVVARYTRGAVILHWLIAILIVCDVCLGWISGYLPDSWVRLDVDTHKSIGITVLGLALLRLVWRAAYPAPPFPTTYSSWEKTAARLGHFSLYFLIFAIPLSGWLHDSAWKDAASHPMWLYGLVPWPRIAWVMDLDPATREVLHARFLSVHVWLNYILYGLLGLHIGAAFKHQFIDKEPEIQRIW